MWQIRSFLRIWAHLLRKSLMENFIFCVIYQLRNNSFSKPFSVKQLPVIASLYGCVPF